MTHSLADVKKYKYKEQIQGINHSRYPNKEQILRICA